MLKLDDCLGKEYGLARFEIPDQNVKVPETGLATLSLTKDQSARTALYLEEKCASAEDTKIAGVFFHSCENLPSMSGSPIFRKDADGGFTVVGIMTGNMPFANGKMLAYAIYSSIMTPFVQGILGSGTVTLAALASTAPTNDVKTVNSAQPAPDFEVDQRVSW